MRIEPSPQAALDPLDLAAYDFHLPERLIAQAPAPSRSGSRLLVLDRVDGTVRHLSFAQFPSLVGSGDLVVVNDTRVFPARLKARRRSGGVVEILLLGYPRAAGAVPCLARPARRLADGEELILEDGSAIRVRRGPDGLAVEDTAGDLAGKVEALGRVPLPPYIRRSGRRGEAQDRERYQTVFAREAGAVAAPTAGLHFDDVVLAEVRRRAEVRAVTLHVGPGTFLPVREADLRRHRMAAEEYEVSGETASALERVRSVGGRVVAVGTTVVRALESAWDGTRVRAGRGRTELFIRPGHRFAAVGALLTNFHLPRSTLLVLVCALAGREKVLSAYAEAVREGYRFYSYGDAMFIHDGTAGR